MILLLLVNVCWSTQFGHIGDGHGGRSPTVYHQRPVSPTDVGIAHRTWPMGRTVKVENLRTGKSATARIIDRGPYGKLDSDGNWFNSRKHRDREGEFRGCADLTPKLAEMIGHDGMDKVKLTLLRQARWQKQAWLSGSTLVDALVSLSDQVVRSYSLLIRQLQRLPQVIRSDTK